jgi:hypothetical protein
VLATPWFDAEPCEHVVVLTPGATGGPAVARELTRGDELPPQWVV